jgi:hypothetical protein
MHVLQCLLLLGRTVWRNHKCATRAGFPTESVQQNPEVTVFWSGGLAAHSWSILLLAGSLPLLSRMSLTGLGGTSPSGTGGVSDYLRRHSSEGIRKVSLPMCGARF